MGGPGGGIVVLGSPDNEGVSGLKVRELPPYKRNSLNLIREASSPEEFARIADVHNLTGDERTEFLSTAVVGTIYYSEGEGETIPAYFTPTIETDEGYVSYVVTKDQIYRIEKKTEAGLYGGFGVRNVDQGLTGYRNHPSLSYTYDEDRLIISVTWVDVTNDQRSLYNHSKSGEKGFKVIEASSEDLGDYLRAERISRANDAREYKKGLGRRGRQHMGPGPRRDYMTLETVLNSFVPHAEDTNIPADIRGTLDGLVGRVESLRTRLKGTANCENRDGLGGWFNFGNVCCPEGVVITEDKTRALLEEMCAPVAERIFCSYAKSAYGFDRPGASDGVVFLLDGFGGRIGFLVKENDQNFTVSLMTLQRALLSDVVALIPKRNKRGPDEHAIFGNDFIVRSGATLLLGSGLGIYYPGVRLEE